MHFAGYDLAAATLLALAGILLIALPRQIQNRVAPAMSRLPALLRGPLPIAYYEGPLFRWCLRIAGVGCLVGALWVATWMVP